MDATDTLAHIRLVPVVVLHDAAQAVPLARSLVAAGIGAIEITLRTGQALESIRQVAQAVPEILLGAGSVRLPEQFQQAREAGAQFAVSPGHSESLLRAARAAAMPYMPGAATPSECLRLLEAGYRLQKFFPAELSGGAAAIRAISAPIPEVRFCATGGISAGNCQQYASCAAVASVGGSWFIPAELLSAGDFDAIGGLARAALRAVLAASR